MDVTFANEDLRRLEDDARYNMGLSSDIVRAYRKCLQVIRSAPDERDFYALKSLHYEKLKGQRKHQRSMRLNRQYRLVIGLIETTDGRQVKIMSVENYH